MILKGGQGVDVNTINVKGTGLIILVRIKKTRVLKKPTCRVKSSSEYPW